MCAEPAGCGEGFGTLRTWEHDNGEDDIEKRNACYYQPHAGSSREKSKVSQRAQEIPETRASHDHVTFSFTRFGRLSELYSSTA